MDLDMLFAQTLDDLKEMERLTEAKIQAAVRRDAKTLVNLLQEQIDPMYRLNRNTLELGMLSIAQQADLRTHITRWATREQYLQNVLEKNLGYIAYLKQLLGISGQESPGLNVGL